MFLKEQADCLHSFFNNTLHTFKCDWMNILWTCNIITVKASMKMYQKISNVPVICVQQKQIAI